MGPELLHAIPVDHSIVSHTSSNPALQLELIRSTLDSQMSALRYIDSEAQQLVAVAQDVALTLQSRSQHLVEETMRRRN